MLFLLTSCGIIVFPSEQDPAQNRPSDSSDRNSLDSQPDVQEGYRPTLPANRIDSAAALAEEQVKAEIDATLQTRMPLIYVES